MDLKEFTQELKSFLKPDLRKLVLVLVFLLIISTLALVAISKVFVNTVFRSIVMTMSYQKAYVSCINTQNVSDVKQCYINEIGKSDPLLTKLSREVDKDEYATYGILLLAVYPGLERLSVPLSNCLLIDYVKYLPELQSTFNLPYNTIFFPSVIVSTTGNCYYQTFFEILLMIVYFYIISCLILWIYTKVKKQANGKKKMQTRKSSRLKL